MYNTLHTIRRAVNIFWAFVTLTTILLFAGTMFYYIMESSYMKRFDNKVKTEVKK